MNILKKLVNRGAKQKFFLNLSGDDRILELGCGKGGNALRIIELYPDVEYNGIDILPASEVPGIINYKVVDLDNDALPYTEEYFDAILFPHVLEHLKTPFQLGKEIKRVLKKGGRIYIEVPNWTSMLVPSFGFHREQHDPFNFFDDPTHVKPWSKHGLYEYLSQSCSLEVQKVGSVRNWLRIPLDFLGIGYGLLVGNRPRVISSFWNIYGWCIYGIGVKK